MNSGTPGSTQLRPTSLLGQQGEAAVARDLVIKGFVILEKNYRQRCGEIDLIAQKDDVIAFIEVKARRQEYFSLPLLVNKSKQRKIIRTARAYVVENRIRDCVLRFDIATVLEHNGSFDISYISDAFTGEW